MIGLFFGDTGFPKLILKRLKKTKKKYLILDLSRKKIFKNDSKSFRINIGQFGYILKFLMNYFSFQFKRINTFQSMIHSFLTFTEFLKKKAYLIGRPYYVCSFNK